MADAMKEMKDNQYGSIFWGLLLLTSGVFFLLANLDIIDFRWMDIWQLWPMLLIFWGVSALPINNYVKLIINIILIGLMFYLLIEYPGNFQIDFSKEASTI
jgi:hypothetical protein